MTGKIEAIMKERAYEGIARCFSLSAGTMLDRFGNEYAYVSGAFGPPGVSGPGGSVLGVGQGWVSSDITNEKQMMDPLTGLNIGLNGSLIAGMGVSWTPGTGAGAFTVSAGVQYGISVYGTTARWHRKDASRAWQWLIEQEIGGAFAVYREDVQ